MKICDRCGNKTVRGEYSVTIEDREFILCDKCVEYIIKQIEENPLPKFGDEVF